MRFVIVTGMSGAGKSTALKMLEDMGYFCVDNLPIPLLPRFVEMLTLRGKRSRRRRWGWMSAAARIWTAWRRSCRNWMRRRSDMRSFFWTLMTMCSSSGIRRRGASIR